MSKINIKDFIMYTFDNTIKQIIYKKYYIRHILS